MAKYRITHTDGSTYEIEADDDATEDQVRQDFEAQFQASSEQTQEVDPEVLNAEEPKNEADTYEGFLTEVAEGAVSGVINIGSGILELGAEAVDLAADTSYAKTIHEGIENWKENNGYWKIDPEGLAGGLTEGIVQFGVPGLGAAAAVSKVSKFGKMATQFSRGKKVGGFGKAAKYNKYKKQTQLTTGQKVALGTQQMVAAGVADAVVTTDGTQTIGDFFDGGPTTTDKFNVGASGSEDAARRLSNRLSMFVEGGALAGALPPALSGLASGFVKATTTKIPLTETSAGQLIAAPINKITGAIAKQIDESQTKVKSFDQDPSSFDKFVATASTMLTSAGYLPKALTVQTQGKKNVFVLRQKKLDENNNIVNYQVAGKQLDDQGVAIKEDLEFESIKDADDFIRYDARAAVQKTDEWKNLQKKKDKLDQDIDAARLFELDKDQDFLVRQKINEYKDEFQIEAKQIELEGVDPVFERIDIAKESTLINPLVESFLKEAEGKFKGLEKDIDEILKKPEYVEQTELTKQKILNTMYEFFNGNEEVTKNINLVTPDFAKFAEIGIPKELLKPMKEMVKLKDSLAKSIIDSSTVKNLPTIGDVKKKIPASFKADPDSQLSKAEQYLEQQRLRGVLIRDDVVNALEKSIMQDDGTTSGFLIRRYRILEDSKYQKTDDMVKDVTEMFTKGIDSTGGGKPVAISDEVMGNMKGHMIKTFNERSVLAQERIAVAQKQGATPDPSDVKLVKDLDYQGVGNPTKEQVKQYIDLVFGNRKSQQKAALRGIGNTYRAPLQKVPMSVLNKRKIDLPTLKAIYGEIKNPREAYVSTIAQMAQFKGVDNFYTQFRKVVDADIAAKGKGSIFENTEGQGVAQQFIKTPKGAQSYILGKSSLVKNQIDEVALGETPYGAMHGIAMPSVMWKSMSHIVMGDMNDTARLARSVYGGFLKLKGYSQYAKTILSPITQVRNVVSASLFAVAQGNVGRGANISESFGKVKSDIIQRYKGNELEYLVDLQRRGIIGSQAELRELQSNIRKGVGYEEEGVDMRTLRTEKELADTRTPVGDATEASRYGSRADPTLLKRIKAENITNKFTGSVDRGIKKGATFVENMYKGGDDVWKIYNYEFELNKLKTARAKHLAKAKGDPVEAKRLAKEFDEVELQGQKIEDLAGDKVRNLVPNYDLTSEVIQNLRKLPIGNFISFPAEIIRTGFNTLDIAMKELSSSIPEIREIGMRRLMGSLGTFIALPIAVREMAMNITDTDEETMQAIQNMSAPFQRASILLPVGNDKNGHKEVIDFSHFSPYDTLVRPFTAVVRSLDNSGKLDKGSVESIREAGFEAISTFFEPFVSESIITARLNDILPKTVYGRGGETISGAKVYKTGDGGDSFGDQLSKSFVHVLEGLTPGASPFRVPTGSNFNDIELGRFARGVLEQGPEPSSGREYSAPGELLRAVTGINTQSYDTKKLSGFKANEFKANRSTAATLFNREINKSVTTPEALIDAYERANEARLKTFRTFRRNYLDLLKLGASRTDIIKEFKRNNIGNRELGSILNNRYIPFFPSQKAFIDARRNNHQLPINEIRELFQQSLNISLDPVEEEVDEGFIEQSQNSVQTPEPVVTNTPTTPVAQTSQVSPVARDINTRLATLLNPNDRIIAERQRNIG